MYVVSLCARPWRCVCGCWDPLVLLGPVLGPQGCFDDFDVSLSFSSNLRRLVLSSTSEAHPVTYVGAHGTRRW